MAGFADFVGTWHAEPGAPYSNHTFTWEPDGSGLRGRWVISTAGAPRAATGIGKPRQLEMQIGEPQLDEGRLLFHINGGPHWSEFRLVGADEAIVGAAIDKLPPEYAGPEHRRSIEGHQVRLSRR